MKLALHNLTIARRLMLGFGLVVFLGIVICALGAWRMHELAEHMDTLARDRMVKAEKFAHVRVNLQEAAQLARDMVISRDAGLQRQARARMLALGQENGRLLDDLDKTIVLPQGRVLFDQVQQTRAAYRDLNERAMKLLAEGDHDGAGTLLLGPGVQKQTAFFKAIDDSTALQRELSARLAQQAHATAEQAAWLLSGLVLLMAGTGAVTAWLTIRSLHRDLGAEPEQLCHAASRVASGDLKPLPAAAQAPQGSVMASLARMQDELAMLVTQVRASSDCIATGSSQIAAGNADLSQRTEEGAANLQQTAASMEELAGTVHNNADTARYASELASGAARSAARGGELVSQVVHTMQSISASSRKIADIIGVIDGIAFQTNILALNAAVEAARAGEQGRGFAVVAGEVRTLAQRSAEAAREIKALIGSSVDRVEAGGRQVDEAGTSMGDIVAQIQQVSQLIAEISHATREQASGIQQVGDALNQLDESTQQNAALVEESATASTSLHQQAGKLVELVQMFQLDDRQAQADGGPGLARPARPAAPHAAGRSPAQAKAHTSEAPGDTSLRPEARLQPATPVAPASDWTSF